MPILSIYQLFTTVDEVIPNFDKLERIKTTF